MKWLNSPTGVPFVTAGGIMFILNDLSGENLKFEWMVFSAQYVESFKIAPTKGATTKSFRRVQMKRRSGCNYPLGKEFKLSKDMTRNLSQEEKELIGKVREWVKKKPLRLRKEIKFKK